MAVLWRLKLSDWFKNWVAPTREGSGTGADFLGSSALGSLRVDVTLTVSILSGYVDTDTICRPT